MVKTAIDYLLEMIREEKMIEIVKCLQPTVQMRGSVAETSARKKGKAILVVGSMNMDVTIEGKKIPVAGGTQNQKNIGSFRRKRSEPSRWSWRTRSAKLI